MMQVVEQTKEEQMVMYMKLPKKKLSEMLIAANDALDAVLPQVTIGQNIDTAICGHDMSYRYWYEGGSKCLKCGTHFRVK